MKLKKKTGLMMVMASTAAVVGVAAVSFAAWTGNNTAYTASASTGTAYLFGFQNTVAEQKFTEKLVPYDQVAASVIDGQKVIVQTIPTYSVFEEYTITLSGVTGGYELYAYVGTANADYDGKTAAELNTAVTAAPETAENGWQALTGASDATYKFNTEGTVKGEVKDMKIYLMLKSNDTTQMNVKDAFTFSVTLATSSVYNA